ncbi:MAG: hypothetical protein ACYCUE_06945 [Steroidobacteraceae bacterium]|jgi:hypothetical protein
MATRRKNRAPRRSSVAAGVLSADQAAPAKVALALDILASELDEVRAACVLVQIALRAQNADHDAEMESCLRTSVAAPLERKITQLRSLIGALGPTPPGPAALG